MLGKEHPNTLTSINNLAGVLSSQGKYKEAEEMHKQVLALREMVLGKEHPSTLGSMNNLALVLSSQGKYKEAEEIYRQALAWKERVLGKEHPDTLGIMNNLADVWNYQSKYKEAEEMHQRALVLKETVLGKEQLIRHAVSLSNGVESHRETHSHALYKCPQFEVTLAVLNYGCCLGRLHLCVIERLPNLSLVE